MPFPSPHRLLEVSLAALTLVQYGFANPYPGPLPEDGMVVARDISEHQASIPFLREEDMLFPDDLELDTNGDSNSTLQYGRCYKIHADGQWLGSDHQAWAYYNFGGYSNSRTFRVCQLMNSCQRQNTQDQEVRHRGNLYLWDFRGNEYSRNGEFVANNNLNHFFPAGTTWRNYAYFEAHHEDCEDITNPRDTCYINLVLRGQASNNNGIEIRANNYLYNAYNGKSVTLQFRRVKCPLD
ncbi:hypothetical protein BDV24DRAFT_157068 [Aspergillus arachidicola]|uniref:Uncharacterized protein n=1 Tax=Aspergillus arachidicola TaxID=656916 RepID=A0A2G7FWW5_9EURO|nr:hypothetical protein BDV24DRAFT_157068 [Aspergillus arachidicola]PIG85063.1 hypothetical protein AARAC_000660 [Aspergillus arachidicola]